MKIIIPVTIGLDQITSSNLSASSFADWDETLTYITGTTVVAQNADGIEHEYTWWPPDEDADPAAAGWAPPSHCVLARNDMDYSLASNKTGYRSYWIDNGATNRMAAFDNNSQAQTAADSIDITLTPGSPCKAVGIVGLNGETIIITVTDPEEGEVYSAEESILETVDIGDYYSWFFEAPDHREIITLTDLPPYLNASIRIQIFSSEDSVSVGEIVVGDILSVGTLLYGSGFTCSAYSSTAEDDSGVENIISGTAQQVQDFDVRIRTAEIAYIKRQQKKLTAVPTIFIGADDYPETVVFGTFEEFDVTISGPVTSECTLSVQEEMTLSSSTAETTEDPT